MSFIDDLKAKADQNGDGKINKEDLDGLQDKLPKDQVEKLKNMADQNGDGKIDVNDIKNIDLGDALSSIKDKIS